MQLFKPYLALFLLLTYTMGFAQGLTPRCNHYSLSNGLENVENVHHHEHHDHAEDEANDHGHIEHNGHLDHCAIDLVLCLLEDVSHSDHAGDDCHCVPTINNRTAIDWTGKLKLVAVVSTLFDSIETEEQTEFCVSQTLGDLQQPFLLNASKRGPPFIS